jgi:hypothetical protein
MAYCLTLIISLFHYYLLPHARYAAAFADHTPALILFDISCFYISPLIIFAIIDISMPFRLLY